MLCIFFSLCIYSLMILAVSLNSQKFRNRKNAVENTMNSPYPSSTILNPLFFEYILCNFFSPCICSLMILDVSLNSRKFKTENAVENTMNSPSPSSTILNPYIHEKLQIPSSMSLKNRISCFFFLSLLFPYFPPPPKRLELARAYAHCVSSAWGPLLECLFSLADLQALPARLTDVDDFGDAQGNPLPPSVFARRCRDRARFVEKWDAVLFSRRSDTTVSGQVHGI